MDKELAKLEEWAVNLINDYETVLRQKNPKSSFFKKLLRFSGELVANPEAYGELLEMARSQNMSAKELIQAIRSIEENLLDSTSRGTKSSRKQLMSDVIHHFYAQRTGGDTLRKLGQADRQMARQALRDIFGNWGNVPENLKSLFKAGHLKGDLLQGDELAAVADYGVTTAGQIDLAKAHDTPPRFVTKTVPGATNWKTAFEGMFPQFDRQRTEGLRAIKGLQPLMDQLDDIVGSKYTGLESEIELQIRRNLFTAKSAQVRAAIRGYYKPLIINNGSTKFHAAGMGSIAGFLSSPEAMGKLAAGDYTGALQSAGLEMAVGEVFGQVAQRALPRLGLAAAGPALQAFGNVSAATAIPEVIARVSTKGERGATELLSEAPRAAVAASLGPISPTLGQSATNAPVNPEAVAERQELERKAAEARQRGGRLSFGVNGVRFTLPEFGLSEMLDLN